jgi:DNA-binding NarL/FixJ family response regulator
MTQPLQTSDGDAVVLIIDALELRRAGVVSLLKPWADESGLKIVEIDPYRALAQLSSLSCKMILLVIGAQGVADAEPQEWIASLTSAHGDTPLVLVADREESAEVIAAFKAGARGFISMSVAPQVAIQACTFIMRGGSFFPPTALVQHVRVETFHQRVVPAKDVVHATTQKCGLTARQQDVLERLRRGESNKLIGRQLRLRESTVKVHIRQIMRKLGAANRTQAALCAVQLDLSTAMEPEEGEPDEGGSAFHARTRVAHA